MAPLRLTSINHISRVCEDVAKSKAFYENILGFIEIRRPSQLEDDFAGSWLFNYGVGIHLIHGTPTRRSSDINPRDDHLSFQCERFADIVETLQSEGIPFKSTVIRHDGLYEIHQVFFHDPDHNMIEICTCECMPVTPIDAACTFLPKRVSEDVGHRTHSPTSSLDLSAMDSRDSMDSAASIHIPPYTAAM